MEMEIGGGQEYRHLGEIFVSLDDQTRITQLIKNAAKTLDGRSMYSIVVVMLLV